VLCSSSCPVLQQLFCGAAAVLWSSSCPVQQQLSCAAAAVLCSSSCPVQQQLSCAAAAVLCSSSCPAQQRLSCGGQRLSCGVGALSSADRSSTCGTSLVPRITCVALAMQHCSYHASCWLGGGGGEDWHSDPCGMPKGVTPQSPPTPWHPCTSWLRKEGPSSHWRITPWATTDLEGTLGCMSAIDAHMGPMSAIVRRLGPMSAIDARVGPMSGIDARLGPMSAIDKGHA
jgi:hypothetical protein